MATIVGALDAVTAWVQANICARIKLKMPPLGEHDPDDENYAYRLVTPTAFPLFVPSQDKLPPAVPAPIPSICVRIVQGRHDLTRKEGKLLFDLVFSTWSSGTHARDILMPTGTGTYRPWNDLEAANFFEKNGEGWRDAWNMVDTALRELGNTVAIDGIEIDRSVPVEFSPLREQDGISDDYPYWFAVLTFGLKLPVAPNIDDINQYL